LSPPPTPELPARARRRPSPQIASLAPRQAHVRACWPQFGLHAATPRATVCAAAGHRRAPSPELRPTPPPPPSEPG
jgi:hypothetical protein